VVAVAVVSRCDQASIPRRTSPKLVSRLMSGELRRDGDVGCCRRRGRT
jgi:hypothetical protein